MTTEKPLNRMNNKYGLLHLILFFKGTVSVILSDPPGKDGYAQVTTVPLKPLSEQTKRFNVNQTLTSLHV